MKALFHYHAQWDHIHTQPHVHMSKFVHTCVALSISVHNQVKVMSIFNYMLLCKNWKLLAIWYRKLLYSNCFCLYPPHQGVSVHGLSLRKIGLEKLPRSSVIWDLNIILGIISMGVQGLATDSSCDVWGCGWSTCLLYDGPLLGLGF